MPADLPVASERLRERAAAEFAVRLPDHLGRLGWDRARLAQGRGCPQHIEPATAGLSDRGLRDGRLARTRRADKDEQAAGAAPGALQQAGDLVYLAAPSGDRELFGISVAGSRVRDDGAPAPG